MQAEPAKSSDRTTSTKAATKKLIRRMARSVLPLVETAAGACPSATETPPTTKEPEGSRSPVTSPKELREVSRLLSGAPDSSLPQLVEAAVAASMEARLAQRIMEGASLAGAATDATREMLRQGKNREALALGHSLQARYETTIVGNIVLAMCYLKTGTTKSAWSLFQTVAGRPECVGAAQEFYAAAFDCLGKDADTILREDIAARRHDNWNVRALLRTAQKSMHTGQSDLARVLVEAGKDRIGPVGSPYYRKEFQRLETWLPDGKMLARAVTTPGAVNFGVMGYQQPDNATRNIGDYIQTIASLGHVVRHTGFTFAGDHDLVDFVESLKTTLKPERQITGTTGALNLLELQRDASTLQDLPEPTWGLLFGWFMHDTFGLGYNIPLNSRLRPIPISVFIRYPEMLTDEAIKYLRCYAPVGCRDWQTVALLTAAGVPSFFSGCLTTTVDTVFTPPEPDTRNARVFVDSPKTGEGDARKQEVQGVRDMSLVENLEQARNWVETYNSTYDKVVTSRLHSYLPARSVGSQVTFLPKNPSDNRFGGLYDLPDAAFDRMRAGILDKLEPIITLIAAGAEEEEVYSTWRRLCADDVAAAQARLEAEGQLPSAQDNEIEALEAGLRASVTPDAPAQAAKEYLDVVVDCRRGEEDLLPELIDSAAAHGTMPLRWWIVASELSNGTIQKIKDKFDGTQIHIIDSANIDFTVNGMRFTPGNRQNLTLAVLPGLLPTTGVAVYLPACSRVSTDISELAAQPAQGATIIARPNRARLRTSGFDMLRRVANRQKANHEKALRLNFQASQSLAFDFAPLDASVMVVDLNAYRHNRTAAQAVGLIGTYGMNFEEALSSVVGDGYQELDPSWNFKPALESLDNAKLHNWRGSTVPGEKWYVPTPDA